ncbi:MAG: DNA primase [Candidatus Eisenbacteria bacterium]|uniref:DNA primase n=1 Tax=Eiseniibacteriota bacterium TaxID=2212470 RepID=A0A538TPI8_UNCEI|nr:MAG: DNA primase [Candidatus Eisenbacteria bacterium]
MTVSPKGRPRGADDWVERVRAATDIVELVGQAVSLKRSGKSWIGLCPFHGEKTPSFSVSPERQLYHCYGCKAGGDVFKFVQETEKVGFLEAAELLSRRAGIPVPERRPGEGGLRVALLEVLEQAAQAYARWLEDPERGRAARDLLEARGVHAETVREFRLGLAPEGWEHVSRLTPRLSEDLLVSAGLAVRREAGRSGVYDRFRNRLIIPLIAPGGTVVGFGARALGDETPKYLNSPETAVYRKSSFLFGLEQARRDAGSDGELVVVEGYFDAIALHQVGRRNTVATSGTALTTEHARTLRRLAPRVALTYDGDQAGREAMMRSLGILLKEGLDVVVVDLPEGIDPDALVRARGLAGWSEARAAAYDPVEFVQRHALRGGPGGRDPREMALQAVVRLASQVSDPLRSRLLLERAAEVFGIGEGVLERAVRMKRTGAGIEGPVGAAVREQRRSERGPERLLLQGLLHAPDALASVRDSVGPEDFHDAADRALALWLWNARPGLPDDEPAASLARELVLGGSGRLDWAAEVAGACRRLRARRLREQLRERRNQLGKTGEDEEAARLMQEIDEIARSLSELSA